MFLWVLVSLIGKTLFVEYKRYLNFDFYLHEKLIGGSNHHETNS